MNPIRFCKILIVDDSEAFRLKVKRQLIDAQVGYYFYEAADGREALAKYIKHKPHIVIMDIMMPNVDGIKATQAIMHYDPNAKIIVASTRDNKETIDAVINSGGAKDYIIKPFGSGDVVMAVSKQLVMNRYLDKSKPSTTSIPKQSVPIGDYDSSKQSIAFMPKPLLHNGVKYGTIDSILDDGELVINTGNNKTADDLLEKAQDIIFVGDHYEIVL